MARKPWTRTWNSGPHLPPAQDWKAAIMMENLPWCRRSCSEETGMYVSCLNPVVTIIILCVFLIMQTRCMDHCKKVQALLDKVCVGRGESAGGVGVSAAAGCASRPAPSAVSAGAKCRVGRRQVPWRPAPGIPCRPRRGCVGRRHLSRPRGFCVGPRAARAGLPLKDGKRSQR